LDGSNVPHRCDADDVWGRLNRPWVPEKGTGPDSCEHVKYLCDPMSIESES
jgi:hypothetical protein